MALPLVKKNLQLVSLPVPITSHRCYTSSRRLFLFYTILPNRRAYLPPSVSSLLTGGHMSIRPEILLFHQATETLIKQGSGLGEPCSIEEGAALATSFAGLQEFIGINDNLAELA